MIFQATKMHDVELKLPLRLCRRHHPERKGTAVTDSVTSKTSAHARRGGLFLIDGRSSLEVVTF